MVAAILGLVLRDFVAPLQLSRNVSAREATGIFVSLLGAHPGLLIGYALLKFGVSIAVGIVILLGGFKASAGIGDAAQGRAALTKSIEMTLGLQVAGSVLLILGAIFAS